MPHGNKGKKWPKEEYPNFGNRGKIPWNKNLTKETDERVAKYAKNSSKVAIKRFQRPGERAKISKANKGKEKTKEHRENIRKVKVEQWQDPNFRKKVTKAITIAWGKRAESSSYPRNYLMPNFNFNSIPIFKALDKVLNIKSRYGGTKAGEKKIGRYFVDYFNKKYQLIIEWNEDWHYNSNDYPEGYDAKKCRYILTRYPDYTYITIRQDKWFKKGDLTEEIAGKIVDYILKKLNKRRG